MQDVFDAGAAGAELLSFLGPRELSTLGASNRRIYSEVRNNLVPSIRRSLPIRCSEGLWTLTLSEVASHPGQSEVLDSLFEKLERWEYSVMGYDSLFDARSSIIPGRSGRSTAMSSWCYGPGGHSELVACHHRAATDRYAAVRHLFDPNKMSGGLTKCFRLAEDEEKRKLKSIKDWVCCLAFRDDAVAGTWMRECTRQDPSPGDDTLTRVIMISLPRSGVHLEATFVDCSPRRCL